MKVDEAKSLKLGYEELEVDEKTSTETIYQVYSKPGLFRVKHSCERPQIQQRGYSARTVRDFVIDDDLKVRVISVIFNQRQFYCLGCSHSFLETIHTCGFEDKISERLKRYIFFLCSCSENSWTKVAKDIGIARDTVASVCDDLQSGLSLIVRNCSSPDKMAVRALKICGKHYTLIADLDNCTVLRFFSGKPEDVLSSSHAVENELFANTKVVVVDPHCKYEDVLRSRVKPTCSIVVDQKLLHNQIFEDIVSAAKGNLSAFKYEKFKKTISSDIDGYDQKTYNFINRTISNVPDLKDKYLAYYYLQRMFLAQHASPLTEREKYELISSLVDNEYVTGTMVEETLQTRTWDDYGGIDELRELADFISKYYSSVSRLLTNEVIENEIFYCVPNTFRSSKTGKHYNKSCFDAAFDCGKEIPVGKSFADITNNMNYRREYSQGNRPYAGPDILK